MLEAPKIRELTVHELAKPLLRTLDQNNGYAKQTQTTELPAIDGAEAFFRRGNIYTSVD